MVELKNVEMPINSIDSNFLQSIYKYKIDMDILSILVILIYLFIYYITHVFINVFI